MEMSIYTINIKQQSPGTMTIMVPGIKKKVIQYYPKKFWKIVLHALERPNTKTRENSVWIFLDHA